MLYQRESIYFELSIYGRWVEGDQIDFLIGMKEHPHHVLSLESRRRSSLCWKFGKWTSCFHSVLHQNFFILFVSLRLYYFHFFLMCDVIFLSQKSCILKFFVHPRNLTWNPKMKSLEDVFPFHNGWFSGNPCYSSFPGCILSVHPIGSMYGIYLPY